LPPSTEQLGILCLRCSLAAAGRGSQQLGVIVHREPRAWLHDLAARVGAASEEHEYGENTAVWLEDGKKVLDYVEADERFSAASFKASLEEQGIAVTKIRLTP
jgi:hypothetical protein